MSEPQFSSQYVFIRGRQLEGTYPGDAQTGIWPVTANRIMRGWGLVREEDWPYDTSIWPPVEPPGLDQLATESRDFAYQRIRSLKECKSVLGHLQQPVMVSVNISDKWYNAPNGRVSTSPPTERIAGTHSVLFHSYDDSRQEFAFRNSWGANWGDKGNGYIPYSTFEQRWVEGWFSVLAAKPMDANPKHALALRNWGVREFGGGIFHCCEFVGSDAGRIGWTFFIERNGLIEIEELFVMPSFRNKGYGTKLVNEIGDYAKKRGAQTKLWVPHGDAELPNVLVIEKLTNRLGLDLLGSPVRWACRLATRAISSEGSEANQNSTAQPESVGGKKTDRPVVAECEKEKDISRPKPLEGTENIFIKLAKELPDVEKRCKGMWQLIGHAMASRLLLLYFGWDWYQQKIAFRDDPDEWMHNLKNDSGPNRILYNRRVVDLGDAIFTLIKNQFKGADTLKHRFLTRPTKPCFVECQIASLLAFNGFHVEVIGESGVRGKDFDLAVSRDGVTLSVEITAKDDGPFTVENILNTLKRKRTQVPSHRAAILYLRIPSEWMAKPDEGRDIFTEAFQEFSRSSQRYNAYVLVWENIVPFAKGFFTGGNMQACYNHNARHPYAPLHLLTPIPGPDGRTRLALSFLEWLKSVESKTLANE